MTAQICEALISLSNGNNPPKANGGPKNDAIFLAMKPSAIIKNHKKADLSQRPSRASLHIESNYGRSILDPNPYIIGMSDIAAAGVDKYTSESTAELDSHANTIVLGNQALVIQDTGTYAEVNVFPSEVRGMSKVPVVDAVVTYDCPFTLESYLLVM